MASKNVILEPERPNAGAAPSAPEGPVRPKAFRRPPGWVAPPQAPSSTVIDTGEEKATVHRLPVASGIPAAASAPLRRHDRLYGILLIAVVAGVNLLAAFLLSAWQTHVKPRYAVPAASFQDGPALHRNASPGDSITLYATPTDERRTLRIERLDTPLDATDAIEFPPANPADDQ